MSRVAIFPADYRTSASVRFLADAIMARAAVSSDDVALIEQADGCWRLKVYEGTVGARRITDTGEVAYRWVEVSL